MDETVELSPAEEKSFQSWIKGTEWYKEYVNEYDEAPDLDTSDYDYRAAWKAGIRPERDPYDKNKFHWPSADESGKMLKSESHPTAWKEYFMKATGRNPDEVGITKEDYERLEKAGRLRGRAMLMDSEIE
jgi:hypothetical protein